MVFDRTDRQASRDAILGLPLSGLHPILDLPFDSKSLYRELIEGKAIKIQARRGEGPEVGLVGTSYRLGWRFIEVRWHDLMAVSLYESCAAARRLYRESVARAFAALYEKLAG